MKTTNVVAGASMLIAIAAIGLMPVAAAEGPVDCVHDYVISEQFPNGPSANEQVADSAARGDALTARDTALAFTVGGKFEECQP